MAVDDDVKNEGTTVEGEYREQEPVDLKLPKVERTPKRRLRQALAAILVLAFLAAIGAGAYWLWLQSGQLSQQQERDRSAQAQLLAQIQNLESELSDLKQQQRTQGQTLDETSRTQATLAQAQTQLGQQQQADVLALQNSLAEWAARSGTQQAGWQLAEAEWLLWLSNMRLQLQQNYSGAHDALTQADALLGQLNHPRLRPVRESIAAERVALKTATKPDIDNIALSLLALSNQVQSLALPARPRPTGEVTPNPSAGSNATQGGWQQVVSGLWDEVRSLVVIRRQEKNLRPWLSENEEQLIYQGLQIRLDAARLAALRGQGSLYQQSVRSAQTWLLTWFDTDSDTVSAVDSELNALAKQPLDVELPDISRSLSLLRNVRQQGLF